MTKLKQKTPNQHAKNLKSSSHRTSTPTTFSDHVNELRRRILWVALVFAAASGIAYNYYGHLEQIVMSPLRGQKLIYLTPGGGFNFIFQITLYAGLMAAVPMLMYQIYSFMRPVLPKHAQRSTMKVASLAVLLLLIGIGYGYFVAVPGALKFLSTFAGTSVVPSLTADSYLRFFLGYVGGLALLFQLPLLLIFWHWIHPMTPGGLLKTERYMILFAFIIGALVSPSPDVFNQSMIALPLIVLYQIGVVTILVSLSHKRRQARKVTSVTPSTVEAVITPNLIEASKQQAVVPVRMSTPVKRSTPATTSVRSMDGFRIASPLMKHEPIRPAARPLTIPPRPSTTFTSTLRRRPDLRIDGISPV